jgi:hypothetical protein
VWKNNSVVALKKKYGVVPKKKLTLELLRKSVGKLKQKRASEQKRSEGKKQKRMQSSVRKKDFELAPRKKLIAELRRTASAGKTSNASSPRKLVFARSRKPCCRLRPSCLVAALNWKKPGTLPTLKRDCLSQRRSVRRLKKNHVARWKPNVNGFYSRQDAVRKRSV